MMPCFPPYLSPVDPSYRLDGDSAPDNRRDGLHFLISMVLLEVCRKRTFFGQARGERFYVRSIEICWLTI